MHFEHGMKVTKSGFTSDAPSVLQWAGLWVSAWAAVFLLMKWDLQLVLLQAFFNPWEALELGVFFFFPQAAVL